MKYRTAISILVALMLAFTSMSSFAGQGKGGSGAMDRGQQMDRDRTFDRDRTQDRDRIDFPDQDRDRDQDKDRIKAQDRDRDRIHLQDPSKISDQDIYGSALMTDAERNQYRKQLQEAKTMEAREQVQARHEEKMRERALQQGQDLVPPGQGPIYGGELMNVQERNQYREQLRLIDSDQEREKFQAQHREKMAQRAKALDLEVEEAE
jgi:hypothetical protein